MSDNERLAGLFDIEPRRPFEPDDRVRFTTLWGSEEGVVLGVTESIDHYKFVQIESDGMRYSLDPARCVLIEP